MPLIIVIDSGRAYLYWCLRLLFQEFCHTHQPCPTISSIFLSRKAPVPPMAWHYLAAGHAWFRYVMFVSLIVVIWSINELIVLSIDWLIDWLKLIDRFGRSIDRSIDGLVDWLVDWLIDWCFLQDVTTNGPASRARIKPGFVVLEIDGCNVTKNNHKEVREIIRSAETKEAITFKFSTLDSACHFFGEELRTLFEACSKKRRSSGSTRSSPRKSSSDQKSVGSGSEKQRQETKENVGLLRLSSSSSSMFAVTTPINNKVDPGRPSDDPKKPATPPRITVIITLSVVFHIYFLGGGGRFFTTCEVRLGGWFITLSRILTGVWPNFTPAQACWLLCFFWSTLTHAT